MKHSIISLSFAALVTAGLATAQSATEEGKLDRTPPTYPELGFDGNTVRVQLADGYRFNAGESTHDLVVQDVGSA